MKLEVGKCVEKIKFKPFDKVRALSGHYCDYPKGSIYNLPRMPGTVIECSAKSVTIDYNGTKSPPVHPDYFEIVEDIVTSPIQEKTVKELVPGVYGKINVGWIHNNKASLGFDRSYLDSDVLKHGTVMHELSSSELRAAAKTFNEIADYLDEQK